MFPHVHLRKRRKCVKAFNKSWDDVKLNFLSTNDGVRLFTNVRRVLGRRLFMQVAHKEGEKGSYTTVKVNPARWPAEQL
jgi:hypothetical protein